jgi:cell division septation protein DedD
MSGGGTRHRFELTRLEIAGVVISAAASLFIVFLLGVYAGRGLGEHRLVDEARVVRLPIAPVAEATPSRDTDLTFDDTLSRGSRAAAADDPVPLPVEERPAREHDAASGAPPAAAERAADAEHEPARAPASGDHAGEHAHVATSAGGGHDAAGMTSHAAAAAHAPDGRAGEGGAHAPAAPGRADARVAVALAGPVDATPPAGPRGVWSVQVTATRESRTANDLVRRLRAKGYDAYVVRAPRQGGMFYRVRVGHFPSMDGASQMVSRLRREPGVPEAFVASD